MCIKRPKHLRNATNKQPMKNNIEQNTAAKTKQHKSITQPLKSVKTQSVTKHPENHKLNHKDPFQQTRTAQQPKMQKQQTNTV